MQEKQIKNPSGLFADLRVGDKFHTGITINKGARLHTVGEFSYEVLQKMSPSEATVIKQIGFGNTRAVGNVRPFAPYTTIYTSFPKSVNPMQIQNPEARNLGELKFKVRSAQYGLPIDQMSDRELKMLDKHARHFENDGGYIKIAFKEKTRRNPFNKWRATGVPDRYVLTELSGETIAYLDYGRGGAVTVNVVRGNSYTFRANTLAKAKAEALKYVRKDFPAYRDYKQSQPTVAQLNKMIDKGILARHGAVTDVEPVAFESSKYRIYFADGYSQETKIPKRNISPELQDAIDKEKESAQKDAEKIEAISTAAQNPSVWEAEREREQVWYRMQLAKEQGLHAEAKKLLAEYNKLTLKIKAISTAAQNPRNPYKVDRSSFTRIDNDGNGNPRYVIHFLAIDQDYDKALKLARTIGGRKFHNKQYGGGIVFQSYNIDGLADRINQLSGVQNTARNTRKPIAKVKPARIDNYYVINDPPSLKYYLKKIGVKEHLGVFDSAEKALASVGIISRKNPRHNEKLWAMATLEGIRKITDKETIEAEEILKSYNWTDAMITKWRNKRIPRHMRAKNATRNASGELYNAHRLDELSGMFQGEISGEQIETVGSNYTPAVTSRLGQLSLLKVNNGGDIYEISFKGDAWLSMDARKNLHISGKNARIRNAKKPRDGNLTLLGTLEQFNYITAKRHIENGELVEYFHEVGEVDGIKPNVFIDRDGFPLIFGGNYDVGINGVEN